MDYFWPKPVPFEACHGNGPNLKPKPFIMRWAYAHHNGHGIINAP